MEFSTRGFASTQPRRTRPGSTSAHPDRPDRLDPASRRPNRSLRAVEFEQFARSIHRDLNPRGPLENLVTRHAVRSAWRLKVDLEGVEAIDAVAASPDAERAARSLEVAITTLDLLQGRRIVEPLGADDLVAVLGADSDADAEAAVPLESNEWPVVPATGDGFEIEATGDEPPIWRDRLVYDFDISDRSPVIKGTWITVSHVVSLIVDGATWADILRTHPELGEDDIRVCVAYAVAEEDATI